jgi:hypothetical protein
MVLDETDAERQQRRAASLANAGQFSTALMAERYMALYQDIYSGQEATGTRS